MDAIFARFRNVYLWDTTQESEVMLLLGRLLVRSTVLLGANEVILLGLRSGEVVKQLAGILSFPDLDKQTISRGQPPAAGKGQLAIAASHWLLLVCAFLWGSKLRGRWDLLHYALKAAGGTSREILNGRAD
jgi:hypothetical protein